MSAKNRCILGLVIFILAYFMSALCFRSYRMNPDNKYYGNYLPSADTGVIQTEAEIRKYIESRTRPPTLLEQIFMPAEWALRILIDR